MVHYYKYVALRPETFELIIKCKEEFLNHHPEYRGIELTNNKIINQAFVFYLDPFGKQRK